MVILDLLKRLLVNNDKVLILVGSADKLNVRNPIPVDIRIEFIKDVIKSHDWEDKIMVSPLNDLTDESDNSHDWGMYLYTTVVNITKITEFTIYYSDGYEIITSWFPPFMLKQNISLTLLARGAVEDGISATRVREVLLSENDEELAKIVPECVFNKRERIRGYVEICTKLNK